jgi:hypothetical protein
MSVMQEYPVTPQSPCTPDCPDRSGDCMLHCPHGYAEYRTARDKVYAARAAVAEALRIASAGKRKASVKKARMKHRHKR